MEGTAWHSTNGQLNLRQGRYSTKYKYLQYIEKEKKSICYHIYCPTCEVYLGEKSFSPKSVHCSYCDSNIDMSKPSKFFLSILLESQLQKLVNGSRIASSLLTHRFIARRNIPMLLRIYMMGSSTKSTVVLEEYSYPLSIFHFLSVRMV